MNPSLRSVASSVCALQGARRIVCIGHGPEPLCLSLREAGYAAWGMDPSGRCDTEPAEPGPASQTGATGMDSGLQPAAVQFDLAISTESPEPGSALDERVALAARALRPGGLFLLPIPYRRSLASRVAALVARWRPRRGRERGEPSWSKPRLQGLLESQGFVLAEIMGMRDGSGQRAAILWVARQGGRRPTAGDG